MLATRSVCARRLARHARRFNGTAAALWDFDVLIVGGGVVGASLACRLADRLVHAHGTRIGIIEGRPPPPLHTHDTEQRIPDPRVYSMTPKSVAFLESLGVWEGLHGRYQRFQQMQVWERGASGSIRFDGASSNRGLSKGDTLGTMVENNTLQAALFEKLEQRRKQGLVEVLCPASVQSIAFSDDTSPPGPARVTIRDAQGSKRQLTTRLLVGADGGMSRVKKARGLPSWGWDYGQRAVVATVKVEGPEREKATAWQIFLKDGPLALLPLWNGYCSIVWSTTPEHADRLKEMEKEEFLTELNAALQQPVSLLQPPELPLPTPLSRAVKGVHHLFESIVVSAALNTGFELPPTVTDVCTPRFAFDLRAEHAKKYIGPRVALIGDAAHTIHPMAGQGLNLGIYDVISIAQVLEDGVRGGGDVGSTRVLRRYEQDRQRDNVTMLGALQALHHLYGSSFDAVKWVRNVGMGTLNGLQPLKEVIARQAMGLQTDTNIPVGHMAMMMNAATAGGVDSRSSTTGEARS